MAVSDVNKASNGGYMQSQKKTILITGGGSGIGLALAEEFRKQGDTVIISNRSEDKLSHAASLGFKTYRMDMADSESIKSVTKKILAECPNLNGVIHSAGIMKQESLISGPSPDVQKETIAINLLGPMLLNDLLIPVFVKQSSAFVMTISSGLAFVPLAMFPSYSASKAAVHSYSESLRYQLKDTPVHVMELAPPYVQTHLTGDYQASDPDAMPLADFVREVMDLLRKNPDAPEILVDRVRMLRYAGAKGQEAYSSFHKELNDGFTAAIGGVF